MQHILTPNQSADASVVRFVAPTATIASLDPGVARFVQVATEDALSPSVLVVEPWLFPGLVPTRLFGHTVLLHWLGAGHEEVIDELVVAKPQVGDHCSTDLRKRRLVLCWNTSTTAFCASAKGLQTILASPRREPVLSLFITPSRVVWNPTRIDDDLVQDLATMQFYTGQYYRPDLGCSEEELAQAKLESVLKGNEPTHDEQGRRIVMLKTRRLPTSSFV